MLKTKELRGLSVDDLKAREKELNKELFQLKMQKGMGAVKDVHAIKKMRHDVARIKNVLHEKLASKGDK